MIAFFWKKKAKKSPNPTFRFRGLAYCSALSILKIILSTHETSLGLFQTITFIANTSLSPV